MPKFYQNSVKTFDAIKHTSKNKTIILLAQACIVFIDYYIVYDVKLSPIFIPAHVNSHIFVPRLWSDAEKLMMIMRIFVIAIHSRGDIGYNERHLDIKFSICGIIIRRLYQKLPF